jgi:hypothetical protein
MTMYLAAVLAAMFAASACAESAPPASHPVLKKSSMRSYRHREVKPPISFATS